MAPQYLEEAWNDATLIAIRAQEQAGLDIVSDGEIRRESYSNRFATALEGVDLDNPGTGFDRSGHPNPVPRITGKIRQSMRRSNAVSSWQSPTAQSTLSGRRLSLLSMSMSVHNFRIQSCDGTGAVS